MKIVPISKKISGAKDGPVVLSPKEYGSLKTRVVPEIPMTPSVKKALLKARKALKEGRVLSLDEFRREMGRSRRGVSR